RGFSTRWLGDDARFAVRPWVTSPPYHELDLVPGMPMQHPLFPVIWSI
ncbi:MAG: phytanoyl-CoA dioxygenase, partial [Gammaproteobacteria bacterium]|nr:phytanoyl-CoA dioxygenase [Gammaproteobacteria bacterium]